VMLGFGNGIESGVNRTMAGYATNTLYLWGESSTEPWQGMPSGRPIRLTNEDTQALLQKVPDIDTLAPRNRLSHGGGTPVASGSKVSDAEVSGDLPAYQNVLPMTLVHGRFINQLDIDERRKMAVIGERIHSDLYGENVNPVGRQIQINNITFTVVGVFKPKRYGRNRDRMNGMIFTPLTTFQQVAPNDNRAFGDWDSEQEFLRIDRLFIGIRAFIWTVGLATLLAGVLGVSNVMLIAIRERQREFGIRKSIGATPGAVVKMVLTETAALVCVSGVLGLFAGLLALFVTDVLTRPITKAPDAGVYFDSPTIDMRIAVGALIALAIASLLATYIPARHAMKINPIEAMRTE